MVFKGNALIHSSMCTVTTILANNSRPRRHLYSPSSAVQAAILLSKLKMSAGMTNHQLPILLQRRPAMLRLSLGVNAIDQSFSSTLTCRLLWLSLGSYWFQLSLELEDWTILREEMVSKSLKMRLSGRLWSTNWLVSLPSVISSSSSSYLLHTTDARTLAILWNEPPASSGLGMSLISWFSTRS